MQFLADICRDFILLRFKGDMSTSSSQSHFKPCAYYRQEKTMRLIEMDYVNIRHMIIKCDKMLRLTYGNIVSVNKYNFMYQLN